MTPNTGPESSSVEHSIPGPIWWNVYYVRLSCLKPLNQAETFTPSQRLQTEQNRPVCPQHQAAHPGPACPLQPPPSTTQSALLRLKTHHMVIDERGPPPGIKWAGRTSSGRAAPASVLLSQASAWVSPTLLRPSSTTPFSGPIKGEVNEAWGGNYTNANRQMSHIVPSYNKQYGCLWYICIRKGGALRKPCFDCVLQRAHCFPSWSSGVFRVRCVAFLCDFCFLLAEVCVCVCVCVCVWSWGLKWCQLKTVMCWATVVSLAAEIILCEAKMCLTVTLCNKCS